MKYDENLKCNVIKRRNFEKRKIIPKKRIANNVNEVNKEVYQIAKGEASYGNIKFS